MTIEQPTVTAESIVAAVTAAHATIRAEGPRSEELRTLTPEVLSILRAAGVFRLTTARERGGPGLTPHEQFDVIEEVASADGSAGWCSYINSTAGLFTAFLDAGVAAELLADPDTPIAGMPVPLGRAERVAGGYRISGHWSFGSGILHAGWVMCGCRVYADGEPVTRADGEPEVVVGLLGPDEVEVGDEWDTLGMRGTGSYDFAADDAFVPSQRSFWDSANPVSAELPLHRFPPLFLFNQTAVGLGIARAAIESFGEVAQTRGSPIGPLFEQSYAHHAIAEAHALRSSARAWCVATLDDIAATFARGETPSLEQRATFRIAMTHGMRSAVAAVDRVVAAAGTNATIRRGTVLERCFRDVHTIATHLSLGPLSYDVAGAMLLGVVPPASMPTF